MPQGADDDGGPAALSDYISFLANNKAYRLLITGEVRNALGSASSVALIHLSGCSLLLPPPGRQQAAALPAAAVWRSSGQTCTRSVHSPIKPAECLGPDD